MKKILHATVVAAAVLVPATVPAQTLTIGAGAVISSLDPHYYNVGPNNAMAATLFSRFLETDTQARIQPGLLASWKSPHARKLGVQASPGREIPQW